MTNDILPHVLFRNMNQPYNSFIKQLMTVVQFKKKTIFFAHQAKLFLSLSTHYFLSLLRWRKFLALTVGWQEVISDEHIWDVYVTVLNTFS